MKLRIPVVVHLNTEKSSTSCIDEQRQSDTRGWLNFSQRREGKRNFQEGEKVKIKDIDLLLRRLSHPCYLHREGSVGKREADTEEKMRWHSKKRREWKDMGLN